MYNTGNFNSSLWNAPSRISSLLGSSEDIIFNGYGLQNAGIITSEVLVEKVPTRDFDTTKIPNDHGRIINKDFFDVKTITLRGMIYKGTKELYETLVDEFKKELSPQNKNLDIKRADGNYRRFVVTATTINVKREKHSDISSSPFEVVFQCLTPFGQSIGTTSSLFTPAVLSFSENIYNSGTAEAKPIWIMIVTSATAITDFTVTNDTTDEAIKVTNAIVASDVIIVDGKEKTITLNGTELDYNGSFPKLVAGSNSYTILFGGTAIAYSLTHKYTPFFL